MCVCVFVKFPLGFEIENEKREILIILPRNYIKYVNTFFSDLSCACTDMLIDLSLYTP